jgi:hypothetical protein
MADNPGPTPDDGAPSPPPNGDGGRRYWIDEDGNVHGVVLTMEVARFTEFTDTAIVYPEGLKTPEKPEG